MHCANQRRILSPTHLSNQLNLNIGLLTMNISGQSIHARTVIEDALEDEIPFKTPNCQCIGLFLFFFFEKNYRFVPCNQFHKYMDF